MRKWGTWKRRLCGMALLAGLGCAGPREADRDAVDSPGTSTTAGVETTPEGEKRLDLGALPEGCHVDKECGALVGVDCGVAADGPYYYVERASGRILEVCGGACMAPPGPENPYCKACPPPGWTCG